MAPYDVDVLIVGGGPTGLMLANELAAFGLTFRIVDKAARRSDKSRAIIVQSRSLELLARHGLADALAARGTWGTGTDIYVHGRKAGGMTMDGVEFADTAYSGMLLVSQADTEDVLEAHLGGDQRVEWLTAVNGIAGDDTGVDAVLVREGAHAQQTEQLRCRYVVGCDGAHSAVRHAAGIAFEGDAYLQTFLLADVHVANWPARAPGCSQMWWGRGFMMLLPYAERQGVVRLVTCQPVAATTAATAAAASEQHGERGRGGGGSPADLPTLDTVRDVVAAMTHLPVNQEGDGNARLYDPVWVASFRLHHRCAAAYRAGRLLLAGDAAHIHSPAGGQGMNTGIGDAANLGWKLAAAVRAETAGVSGSTATLGLLASYSPERRRIGQYLLRTTDSAFVAASTANPLLIWLRNTVMRWLAPLALRAASRRRQMIAGMSQLRVRYRHSAVVASAPAWARRRGSADSLVRGGDRAPDGRVLVPAGGGSSSPPTTSWLLAQLWRDGGLAKYHLVLFTGAAPSAEQTKKSIRAAADPAALACLPTGLATAAHVVAAAAADTALEGVDQPLVDVDGYLHRRYGFGAAAGYVLVRPDGYVEHIGLLASLPELAAWLPTRGTEAPARPWWRWW